MTLRTRLGRSTLAQVALLVPALLLATGALTFAQKAEERKPRFVPARVLTTTQIPYPPNSLAHGTVILEVQLDDLGQVRDVQVLRDIKSLTEPALRGVRQWKFEPARLDDRPVSSSLVVAVTFNIPPWCWPTNPHPRTSN